MKYFVALAIAAMVSACGSSAPGLTCNSPKWVASTAGTVTDYQPKVSLIINNGTMDLAIKDSGSIKINSRTHYYSDDWHSFDDKFKNVKFTKNGDTLVSSFVTVKDVQNPSIGNQYWYKRQTTNTIEYNTSTKKMVQKTAYKNYGGPDGKVYEEYFKIVAYCK